MFLPFFYQVYKLWSGGKQGQEAAVLWRMIWGFVEEGKKEELWIVEEGKGVVFPLVGGGKVGSGHVDFFSNPGPLGATWSQLVPPACDGLLRVPASI